ncbi:MAG: hypothetical protein ABIM99_05710 [Candidatus Dojkabacteria bacterium]
MRKVNYKKFILISLLIVIVISSIYLVLRPKLYFKGLSLKEQIEITKDLLSDENVRMQIIQGPGIELSLTRSPYCGRDLAVNCEYISCKLFTSWFGDNEACYLVNDVNGKYIVKTTM